MGMRGILETQTFSIFSTFPQFKNPCVQLLTIFYSFYSESVASEIITLFLHSVRKCESKAMGVMEGLLPFGKKGCKFEGGNCIMSLICYSRSLYFRHTEFGQAVADPSIQSSKLNFLYNSFSILIINISWP